MHKSPYFAPLLVALGLCLISSTKVAELVKPTTKNAVAANDFSCSASDLEDSTVECLEATHFVVGAGAMGMAFVDTLIHEDPTALVVLVDREAQPGGHWVHAYPFVTLHQSAVWYGVNSRPLEPTPGAYKHLSNKNEILAYYKAVLDDLIATGRLRYFPLSEADVDGPKPRQFKSMVSDVIFAVSGNAKIVDATYTGTQVPSTHGAHLRYSVEEGVDLVPINDLPSRAASDDWECFCIVGAGKTGMDAVLWLLNSGIAPERIQWITPNDAWVHLRETTTPPFFPGTYLGVQEAFTVHDDLYPILDNVTYDSLLAALETAGIVARIDPSIEPTSYRTAIISRSDLKQLRRIRDAGGIIRHGRLKDLAVKGTGVQATLQGGKLELPKHTLVIDCSANPFMQRSTVPIFNGSIIRLQITGLYHPASAAVAAHLEVRGDTDAEKNRLLPIVPRPAGGATARREMSRVLYQMLAAENSWRRDREFWGWLTTSRVSHLGHTISPLHAFWEMLKRPKTTLQAMKMQQLLGPAMRRICNQEGGDC